MSQIAAKFASYITQPLNVYNFQIKFVYSLGGKVIDDENALLYVQSATFPKEDLQEVKSTYKGETVTWRAKPANGGDWSITVPEGDGGQVRKAIEKLKHDFYNQRSGAITPTRWFDIIIYQNDLQDNPVFKCVLKGCWLKGRGDNQVKTDSVTESWSNTFTFHYTWLDDNPNAVDAPNNQPSMNPFTGE